METIGERLKQIMMEKGLTQYRLAKLSGVSQPSICALLNDETRTPRTHTIGKLAKAMNCTIGEIMDESHESESMKEAGANFNTIDPAARELLDIFDQLNADGRRTLITIAAGLLDNPALREEKESKMAK